MRNVLRTSVVLALSCVALLVSLQTSEAPGLSNGAPTPIVHLEAADYVAGSTTWTNRGSTGGTVATATGGMTKTATGPQAAVFSGKESSNSDQVSGSIGSTASTDKVSVEMWIKMKDNGSTQNAFGSMLFSWLGSPHYNVYHYKNAIGFNTINSEIYGVDATALVGEWSHVVFVMVKGGATSDQKIYINGVRQTEVCNPPVTSLSASCNWPSGRAFNSSGNFLLLDNGYSSNTWNAKADMGMVRIYNTELTQSEITAAYNATVNTYVDVAPTVLSVSEPTSPSSSRNLSYSYTFSESIAGLATSDFTQTGTATGCVVTPSASTGTVITVNVSCTSDGTFTLSLSANSITDSVLNTGPATTHSAATVIISVPAVTTTAAPVTTTAAPVVTTTAAPVTTTVVPVVTTVPTQSVTAPTSPAVAQSGIPQSVTNATTPMTATTKVQASPVTTVVSVSPSTTLSKLVSTSTTSTTLASLSKIVVPAVAEGGAVLEVNGEATGVTIARTNNQLVVTSKTFAAQLTVVKRDGSRSSLSSSGDMAGVPGDSVTAEFSGLKPGSNLEVRLYSDPVLLGKTTVGATGTVTASYEIPVDIATGSHSLAILGSTASGAPFSFFSPVQVGSQDQGPGWVALLIAIPVLVAIGVGLFLPPVLRRRRVL